MTTPGHDDDHDEEFGPIPEQERLPGDERIADPQWESIIAEFRQGNGAASEMPPAETREALQDSDGYAPDDPGPIGIANAPPLKVLCWFLAVGGPLTLLFCVMFLRPIPGGVLLAAMSAAIAGIVGLFWLLPTERGDSSDDGSRV